MAGCMRWATRARGPWYPIGVQNLLFRPVFLVLLLAASCSFSLGSKKIDSKKVETLIKGTLDKKLAGNVDPAKISIECPKDIQIEKDATFNCEVTAGEHKLVATVTQQDDQGTVAWEITDGIVELTIRSGTQDLVSQYIDSSLGTTGASVECPEKIEIKKGGQFECTSVVDGVTVRAHVEQQNDQGNVSYKLVGGVVFSEKLGIIVEAELGAQKVKATVDCGSPIRLSKPGTTFTCNAVDSNGQTATIDVRINDESGDVNWKLRANEK